MRKTLVSRREQDVLSMTSAGIGRVYWPIALAQFLLLIACSNKNVTATVECGAAPGDKFAISQEDSFKGPPTRGLISSRLLPPGALLEIEPATTGSPYGRLVSTYTGLSSPAERLTPRQDSAFWTIVDAPFYLGVSSGFAPHNDFQVVPLIGRIVKNTTAVISGARRASLRDPLAMVNSDDRAKEFILSGPSYNSFIMVIGLLYGDQVDLVGLNYSDQPEIAVNTLEVGDVYLHYKFDCSILNTINVRAPSSRSSPIGFLYRHVRISDAGKIVWSDAIIPDIGKANGI